MVAGHLEEKHGFYYAVLSYKDMNGKRQRKWFPTGYTIKGNKKKAEQSLLELRQNFTIPVEETPLSSTVKTLSPDMLFSDYLEKWLKIAKSTIEISTYVSYSNTLHTICPYFKETGLALSEIAPSHIQDFYLMQLDRVLGTTVIRYHAVLHRALKYAVRMDLIPFNPVDKVDRPKKNHYQADYYTPEEINELIQVSKGTLLELPILFGSFYGLRRSEVVGLKWDAIDFENNTLSIQHTVLHLNIDGVSQYIARDTTKTKSSRRTLPLVPFIKERLLEVKAEQKERERLCGKAYVKKYKEYICVNFLGDIIDPNYITSSFKKFLAAHDMRPIRFHDLRHSCASLMISNGVPLKQIQEWLGHSDFSTTANIYAHLDASSKWNSASTILECLGKEE